jgi:hypothetical protein
VRDDPHRSKGLPPAPGAGAAGDDHEYRQAAADRLRAWVLGAEIRIRITPEKLDAFLRDRVYKTLFVTGTSGGTKNIEVRKRVETIVMNVPIDIAPEDRPVHGYLAGSTETGDITRWGTVVLGLRSEVRDDATFVLGDTIDGTGHANLAAFAPVSVTEPVLTAAAVDRNVVTSATMGEACLAGYGYAEVHVYGRVRTDNVARAVFTGPLPASILHRKLLDANIRVEIGAGSL